MFEFLKNKSVAGEDPKEGMSDQLPELTLEMSDEELLDISKKWMKSWNRISGEIKAKRDVIEEYYLGNQPVETSNEERPLVDNLEFEALETYLPMATKKNPDPMVICDETPEGKEFAEQIAKTLVDLADRLRFKLRLKRIVRFWAMYYLGVLKIAWSEKDDEISLDVIRPHKLIMDPDGFIDDDMRYTGEFLGEYKEETISDAIKRFPDQEKFLMDEADKMEGTKITYVEWWTNDFTFWKYKETILGKMKNPHWNYEFEEDQVDEEGNPTEPIMKQPYNHFKYPQMPYVFLSIFNLNKHPYDETSLLEQALPMQDLINRRQHQINKNVDEMNNGWVITGGVKNKEEATQLVNTLRDGGAAYMPDGGTPRDVVDKIGATSLPADVFNNLFDARNELRNIFGVRGSTPQGTINEQTLGGKVVIKNQDTSRVGGGTSEYIEQFSDRAYNYMVQMMAVYYDEVREKAVAGKEGQLDSAKLGKEMFEAYQKQVTVSVKEGSLIPKDPMSEANEALTLATAGLIDPVTMFDKLDFPDPLEAAKRLYMWQAAPQLMFPELGQAVEVEQEIQATKEAIRNTEEQAANNSMAEDSNTDAKSEKSSSSKEK